MSAVPEKVLNWLYSVLTSNYHDVNRTYSDAAEALSSYPSLSPRTEVYTFENGTSALLLQLSGTVPVQFRGTTYRFPIAVWVPHAYPKESPIVYVTPAQGMLVRPGQHVAGDGRVYHPYLAGWSKFYDKSSISDFLQVLRGVFAKEPPVISSQQMQSPPAQQIAPPPVPPPPDEWRRSQQPPPLRGGDSDGDLSRPPPIPPKPGESPRQQAPTINGHSPPLQQGPPLPPLPPLQTANGNLRTPGVQGPGPITPPQRYTSLPNRQSTLGSEPSPFTPNQLPQIQRVSRTATDSPVSPISPDRLQQRPLSRYDQLAPLPPQQPQYQHQAPYPQYAGPPPIQGYPPAYHHPPAQYAPQQPPAPPIIKPTQPALDLLTSPLDVTLPSQTGDQAQLPAPPVPPNPEKDALLHALSQTLVAQMRQILDSNNAAIAPLLAQNYALRTAQNSLQSELQQLSQLTSAIESNENLLREAMSQADTVIRDAAGRQRPNIDDVLVPPFVAHKQLYEVVAEVKAAEDARAALGRALDKGRVGVEVWVRQMRSVGREEFLRKALMRKVGVGLGLDQGQSWGE